MDINEIPVIINCRDRVLVLRELVAWLELVGVQNICLLDNDSTYEPLLEYYESSPHKIILLGHNGGHGSPWISGTVDKFAKDTNFIVSDPDVMPVESCPHDVLSFFHDVLQRYPQKNKVGFSLKIDDIPNYYSHKERVIYYETQFWHPARQIEPSLYDSPIDTTFAMYRPNATMDISYSLRTGPPYIARHMGWYLDTSNLTEEEIHYRNRASKEVASWSKEEGPSWA